MSYETQKASVNYTRHRIQDQSRSSLKWPFSCSAIDLWVASVRVENVTYSVRPGPSSEFLVLNVTGICTGFPPVKPTFQVQSAADWREEQNMSGSANLHMKIHRENADSHGIVHSEFSMETDLPWSLTYRHFRLLCTNRYSTATSTELTIECTLFFQASLYLLSLLLF